MKLKGKNINIVKKMILNQSDCYVEEISICQTVIYLYFKLVFRENVYRVYNISNKTYENVLAGADISEEREDFVGNMPVGMDEKQWICEMQNTNKVFGSIGKKAGKQGILILTGIILIGLVLVGIGLWRMEYNKQLLSREAVVEGEISHYTRTRYAGYYNVYVSYRVDGKNYEGYNGKTAIEPKERDTMPVYYDSDNPGTIIVKDEMNENTFRFIYMGAIIAIVGGALLVSAVLHKKHPYTASVKPTESSLMPAYEGNDPINIWNVISGKEYKNCIILLIIFSIIFVVTIVLKIVIPNTDNEKIWLNLLWLFAIASETAGVMWWGWMTYEKKKFLSSPDLASYSEEIRMNIVKTTPTEVITGKYVFKRLYVAEPIDYSMVAWVYRKRASGVQNGADNIVFKMINGKTKYMNYRISFTESDMYNLIKRVNPHVMIGASPDNYKKYRELIKNS